MNSLQSCLCSDFKICSQTWIVMVLRGSSNDRLLYRVSSDQGPCAHAHSSTRDAKTLSIFDNIFQPTPGPLRKS